LVSSLTDISKVAIQTIMPLQSLAAAMRDGPAGEPRT
jgi:hypothetical protein